MASKRPIDCIVVGDANVDLMMDGVPGLEFGKEKLAASMDLILGGSSAITAFNLAALGARVGFVGVLGKDLFGGFVEERLKSAKVDVSNVRRVVSDHTGISVWMSDHGKRGAITYAGTIAMLHARDIRQAYLKKARHLHVGHYFLLKNFHAGAAALFRKAKRLGLTTSMDCNYDPAELWSSTLHEVLQYTDIFFPNETEAMRVGGCASPEASAQEIGKLAGTVVVKLGERGAYVFSGGSGFHVPGKKVRCVDATGAGDSFNAGFLSQFLKSATLRECARAGNAAGARCVTRVGGTAAFERNA